MVLGDNIKDNSLLLNGGGCLGGHSTPPQACAALLLSSGRTQEEKRKALTSTNSIMTCPSMTEMLPMIRSLEALPTRTRRALTQ